MHPPDVHDKRLDGFLQSLGKDSLSVVGMRSEKGG